MLAGNAATEDDNLRRLHTWNATQQNTKSAVSLLQAGGADLNRHTAGNFTHRGQLRKRAVGRCDRLVGDGGRARLHQALRLHGISGEMQIGKQHLSGTEHFALVRLRLFDFDDQLALLEDLSRGRSDRRSSSLIRSVIHANAITGARLDYDFVSSSDQLPDPRRDHADTEFVVLDLFRDTNAHDRGSWR